MNALTLLTKALATWRLSHLLMYESGPWNLILTVRTLAGVRHDDDGNPEAYPDGSVFECFLCFSVWVAMATGFTPSWLSRPFALSALAIWAEKWYKAR